LEHSGKPSPKAYFLPHWRAIQSGVSPVTIALDAVRASHGANGASYAPSLAPIDSFLASFEKPEDAPPIFLLSNDCVADTPGSRLKVYFLTAADTLNKVKAMYSLDGRLKGPKIDASLEKISEFWYFFFGLDPSDPASDDKVCILGPRSVFVYEMRSTEGSEPDVDVKLHLPMWLAGKNDGQIADTLAEWFEKHGQRDLAERYKDDLLTSLYVLLSSSTPPTFMVYRLNILLTWSFNSPKHDIAGPSSSGTHTFLSITHTPKTGLYMVMYLSPRLPQFEYGVGEAKSDW
jgi:DMATS type aromatic prenyltransferase